MNIHFNSKIILQYWIFQDAHWREAVRVYLDWLCVEVCSLGRVDKALQKTYRSEIVLVVLVVAVLVVFAVAVLVF